MLIDITNKPTRVNPRDAESYDLLIRARSALGTLRFNKDCRIIDAELAKLVKAGQANNKLVFTKAGFLVGMQAQTPHVDVQHIWDSAELAFASYVAPNRYDELAAEMQLKFIGGLVRWRISLLDDTWLVYRRTSGKFNPITGKEISVSEYWINNDFVLPQPPKSRGFSMGDLKARMEGHRA